MSLYKYSKIERDYKYYLRYVREHNLKMEVPVMASRDIIDGWLYPEEYSQHYSVSPQDYARILIGLAGGILITCGDELPRGGYPYNLRLQIIDYNNVVVRLTKAGIK